MISSISVASAGANDSCLAYVQLNNNGYMIDENLKAMQQSDRLQYISKKVNGVPFDNKMNETTTTIDNNNAKFSSINHDTVIVANQWYKNASKKTPNIGERQLSTSTEDSDSGVSSKNGSDHLQQMNACNSSSKSDEEKPMPDHHARRPMNAFLIFCKRHRGIVRERYPNLENRAITKILGDWWANLDESEKSSYTNLAKEYKDAFFNANPDFKWYKLPAPPLRTSGPRHNSDRHASFSSDHDENVFDIDVHSTKFSNKYKESTGVGTFKFADEAQMGGLNRLMVEADAKNGKCANNNNNNDSKPMMDAMETDEDKDDEKDGNISDSKDELHRVLGETRSFLQDTMKGYDQPDEYPFDLNATNPNIPEKSSFHSPTSTSSPEMKHFESDSPDDDLIGYDSVFGPKKSSRACKGKRYMEFMNAQKLNIITKRTKPRTISSSSATSLSPTQPSPFHMRSLKKSLSCSQAVQKLDYDTFDHAYANHSANLLPSTAAMHKNETDTMTAAEAATAAVDNAVMGKFITKDENAVSPVDSRKFVVTEFELEQKINALTAHNLDDYLARKQDTKKKKKTNEKRTGGGYRKVHKAGKSKAKSTTARTAAVTAAAAAVASSVPIAITKPRTIEEAKQRLAMVGSQKRKARKESITRRDVQQVTAIVQSFTPAMMGEDFIPVVPISIPSSSFVNHTNRCGNNNGLLMLATMAEVAAANYAA